MNLFSFQRYRIAIALGLGLLTASFMGGAAHAQAQTAPKFGSVDMAQVLADSKARQKGSDELNGTVSTLRKVLQQLQERNARFLSEVEIKELAALYEKPTPTDAEKKRISALEDAATLKSAAKGRLENTASPTEDQRKEYGTLTATEQSGAQVLKGISDGFSQRVDARQADLQTKQLATIKAAITKLAKEQGLSVVFDSQVAYFTANDITADVVKEINNQK